MSESTRDKNTLFLLLIIHLVEFKSNYGNPTGYLKVGQPRVFGSKCLFLLASFDVILAARQFNMLVADRSSSFN